MGFLKNILSNVGADDIINSISEKGIKSVVNGIKNNKTLTKATSEAAESVVAGTVSSAINSLNNESTEIQSSNSLSTPSPPPVPQSRPALSVMIAVNGQTYGPYERDTLVDMIRNGSLTKETYVFIEGMSNWEIASNIPEVADLFGAPSSKPAVPPIPWANKAAAENLTNDEIIDNTLSPRLNKLISAAVADGEISDLERQVLIRNAQEEGVSMDEFVMVLEARLFQQQQILKAKEEEKQHKQELLKAQQQAALRAQNSVKADSRKEKFTKCPSCGAPIDTLSTRCPECGRDYYEATNTGSAWEKLCKQLQDIEENTSGLTRLIGVIYHKKADLIKNFPIPNNKTELFDFFTNCAPLGKSLSFNGDQRTLDRAYRKKAEQILIKARILLKEDPKLLNQLEEIAKNNKVKA